MIKVIHILTDCNIGGAGRWLLNFLKAYDKTKLSVEVALPKDSLLTGFVKKTGTCIYELPYLKEQSFDASAIKPLYQFLKQKEPDIVHTHACLTARIAARLAKIGGIVATRHCLDDEKSMLKRPVNRIFNTLLCDKIIAISEAVKDNLIEHGTPREKVTVIYNGIPSVKDVTDTEKKEIRESFGISPLDSVVGIVARLEELKGHKYFLEAASYVKKEINNIKFVIAGTGSQTHNLKPIVKQYDLEDSVIFTGYFEDVDKLYRIFDINVMTSVSEALCLSLIEGMSAGLPSVAFETGGITEVINEECGILVPPMDSKKLSEAIIKLLNNKELGDKMGNEGKRIADSKFSAKTMSNKIESLYNELAFTLIKH